VLVVATIVFLQKMNALDAIQMISYSRMAPVHAKRNFIKKVMIV
jgi:hypothetical protein